MRVPEEEDEEEDMVQKTCESKMQWKWLLPLHSPTVCNGDGPDSQYSLEVYTQKATSFDMWDDTFVP